MSEFSGLLQFHKFFTQEHLQKLANDKQLLWNEQKTLAIAFDGELYGREIRDAGAILRGYEEYGEEIFQRLEGMYVFAIFDVTNKSCLLVRDRLGQKPLYYCQNTQTFAFASSLKSLCSYNLLNKEIDREALSRYFQLTYIPAPKTIFRGIYKLPAGYILKVEDNGKVSTKKYWDIQNKKPADLAQDYVKVQKGLRDLLFQSVADRMQRGSSYGAYLSGGFDSSTMVGIMSQISDKPIDTFTISFKEKAFDESDLAALVAKKNHTRHHVLTLDWQEMVKNLDGILASLDEPYADSSLLAAHTVTKFAGEYVQVALTGDAGDELFGGYDKYLIGYYANLYNRIPAFVRKGFIEPAVAFLPHDSFVTWKAKKLIAAAKLNPFEQRKRMMCLGFKADECRKLMRDGFVDDLDFVEEQYGYLKDADEQMKTQYVDIKTVLEGDMLPKITYAGLGNSLQTRVPMLNHKVVEFAFSLPSNFKIKGSNKKIIFKDTFKDLLPRELFSAPKHGFGVPIDRWLGSELQIRLVRYADPDYLEQQGIFDKDYIGNIISGYFAHKNSMWSELWAFFVFQNWYERVMK